MAICLITGTAKRGPYVIEGAGVYVHRVIAPGELQRTKRPYLAAISDAAGILRRVIDNEETEDEGFILPQGCAAYIYSEAEGLDAHPGVGTLFQIPNVATVDIESLLVLESLPSAGITYYTQTITEDTEIEIGSALRAVILIDTSDGDVTATAPAIAGLASRSIVFKKIANANTATVDGNGGEFIDGALVYNLEMENEFVEVTPAGGMLRVIGKG